MSDGIKEGILDTRRGAIIVCAPKGAGKTTGTVSACHDLKETAEISGFLKFSLCPRTDDADPPGPWHMFRSKFGASHTDDLFDMMPIQRTDKPIVIILDNVDDHPNKEGVKAFVKSLAKPSVVAPTGQHYLVVVLCQDVAVAKSLLTINSRRKIRMLEYGAVLVDGTDTVGPSSWKAKGFKWKKDDCDKLITKFEENLGRHLARGQRDRLLELAEAAGTPGFIRDFFQNIRNNIISYPQEVDSVLTTMEKESKDIAQVWEDLRGLI